MVAWALERYIKACGELVMEKFIVKTWMKGGINGGTNGGFW